MEEDCLAHQVSYGCADSYSCTKGKINRQRIRTAVDLSIVFLTLSVSSFNATVLPKACQGSSERRGRRRDYGRTWRCGRRSICYVSRGRSQEQAATTHYWNQAQGYPLGCCLRPTTRQEARIRPGYRWCTESGSSSSYGGSCARSLLATAYVQRQWRLCDARRVGTGSGRLSVSL